MRVCGLSFLRVTKKVTKTLKKNKFRAKALHSHYIFTHNLLLRFSASLMAASFFVLK